MLLAALALMLCACAVPNVNREIAAAPPGGQSVVGAHGPLSDARSRAILDALKRQSPNSDILNRHLAIERAVTGTPLIAGNRTVILHDGGQTFAAMFDAIRSAQDTVNLEFYTFENIESGGERLGALLLAKRQQGVAINILYDSYGSMDTPPAFLESLRAAGCLVLEYNPIDPLRVHGAYLPNDRDHRKLLIVDGLTAFVGGVNLYTGYQAHAHGELVGSGGDTGTFWHDTDMEIEGPAVAALQQLFVQHWNEQNGPPLDPSTFFPPLRPRGHEVLDVLGSTPKQPTPEYYATILSAITNAEQRIWLTTAYFVPTAAELSDLKRAARRGVDVRLMLPSHSDSHLAFDVGRSYYEDLLEAGVKIYEIQNEVLHSKTAVIDGVWSVIGSSNFDHRSVLFNDEVDVVVLGRATAAQLETEFEADEAKSRAIDAVTWSHRPLGEHIRELFARITQSML
ncbi:MAG: phospholipase D-like domain-containing protein [Stellaceae bacterium]